MEGKPQHGRRAGAGDDAQPRAPVKGWGDESVKPDASETMRADGSSALEVPNLDDGVDGSPTQPDNRDDEEMAKEVAAAPTDYHSQMPRLQELNNSRWAALVARHSEDVDLSCLTSALTTQLDDEDVAWNPDLLLVQLTSELLDAVEKKGAVAASASAPTTEAAEAAAAAAVPAESVLRDRRRVPTGDKK